VIAYLLKSLQLLGRLGTDEDAVKNKRPVSRRAFLRAGALATLGLTAACAAPTAERSAAPTVAQATPTATQMPPTRAFAPTATQAPRDPTATHMAVPPTSTVPLATHTAVPPTHTAAPATPAPAATALPTLTPLPHAPTPARADLVAHYPQVAQSVVSLIYHAGAWDGDRIVVPAVLEMLDAAIVQLTGLGDALAAWSALFDPSELVGIKVNTISRYTTTPQVAYAVAQRLQDAGIPAEQIVLFDRSPSELEDRGFALNDGGVGVQCRGPKAWEGPATVAGTRQRVHDVMLSCDALINIPALKEHGISGFTSALKNHYGTIDSPGALHPNECDPYIPELNALPVIRDKTRLIVGDFLRTCPYNWSRMTKENTIAMSFDPVAHDWVARQILVDRRKADGKPGAYIEGRSHYLDTAVQMGLGADVEHTEVRKASLG